MPTVAKLCNDCTARFFADPCCVWQKGENENLNSLFREFYPKGRNLSKVVSVTLKRNLTLISAKPRKVLNFHAPRNYETLIPTPVPFSLAIH